MNMLAKYQIVDDIFKRATYIPDGKKFLGVFYRFSCHSHSIAGTRSFYELSYRQAELLSMPNRKK